MRKDRTGKKSAWANWVYFPCLTWKPRDSGGSSARRLARQAKPSTNARGTKKLEKYTEIY
jgi:hypothetical protein